MAKLNYAQVKIGFFINPLAGFGASLNRKGSDLVYSIDRGSSTSFSSGREFLLGIRDLGVHFLVPGGIMGADAMEEAGISDYEIVYFPKTPTEASDTISFVKVIIGMKPQLLIFCGGDGTARDILSAGFISIPVVGVPTGIKMESSVFAISVQHAVNVTREIVGKGIAETEKAEIVDIPEEELDTIHPHPRFYGELVTPANQGIVSSPKLDFYQGDTEGIADYLIETMVKDTYYIIGPGSTCKSIIARLGQETNLLGFDLVRAGRLMETDISEQRIFEVATTGKCKLVISPIGGQNFLLGRGNKQISARVVRALGFANIIVLSAQDKLTHTKKLYIDLDTRQTVDIPKYTRVIIGYGMFKIVKLEG
ncbi:MAG: ATP-NAD kinase family protein [Thermoplasmataceae archaeon]